MKRLVMLLVTGVLSAVLVAGCGGGEGAKGVNKDKDRPRPADKDTGK